MPLRVGTRPIGLLAAESDHVDAGTLDAIAGLAALAVERTQLLEERRNAALTRQSEALKTTLLASIGHDLRTPLTAIRVGIENLRSRELPPAERDAQTDLILAEVARLDRLFQNLLEMARLDAGAVTAERRRTHPSEIIEAARAHTPPRRSAPIASSSTSTVRRPVHVDPRLTATALGHVLENAAQHAPPATDIAVTARVQADGLHLTVRDQGPGIPEADLPHVFERFYRGAGADRRPTGTGMGLWIARGVLAAQGGQIWADNPPDGGARVTMRVPVRRARLAKVRRMSPRHRILLVDDEVALQRTVATLLRTGGYDVVISATGVDALRQAEDASPDLVVLDLGLPDLDGLEVCRRLRTMVPVPIIVLSARTSGGGESGAPSTSAPTTT